MKKHLQRNKYITSLLISCISILAAGCTSSNDDLQSWMQKEAANMKGQVSKLPEITPYQAVAYIGREKPDPFSPKKNSLVISTANAPDANRKKEFLETFPLEQLAMSGILIHGKTTEGLVKAPDGTINKVQIGNFMGLNYGKVTSINQDRITLKETIMDAQGTWSERDAVLESSSMSINSGTVQTKK